MPVEHALPSSIVGVIETHEQCFEVRMTGNIDPENLAGDTTVEALDHSIGLGRIGFGRTADGLELCAGVLEFIGREA